MRDVSLDAALAVTRFGMGARPGDIAAASTDPHGWLAAQIHPDGATPPDLPLKPAEARLREYYVYQDRRAEAREMRRAPETSPDVPTPRDDDPTRSDRRELLEETAEAFTARMRLGATTDRGFAERWALFWCNWFTVSAVKFQTGVLVPQYEAEAIRPRVFGRFEDLLVAAESHPAMLTYLDQAQSVGPNSRVGRRREAGLNENLAREILELHTVGTDAGYTQSDVTEFARALTGWSMIPRRNAARQAAREAEPGPHGYVFQPLAHEPGVRRVMNRSYAAGGRAQGLAILRDLARHPATARRAAQRIAAHFVADAPPEALVARLEQAWIESDGDLSVVARALIAAPESWTPQPRKLKTPYELLVSAWRAVDGAPRRPRQIQPVLTQLGQPAWSPPSPEGWPDEAAAWGAPDAIVRRMSWAEDFARQQAPQTPPVDLADAALGERLSARTRTAVSRAESRDEALALLLMSPEFQRR